MLERIKTTETRRVLWRNRKVSVSRVEWCAVQLLKHVEESVWAQGLGAPSELGGEGMNAQAGRRDYRAHPTPFNNRNN